MRIHTFFASLALVVTATAIGCSTEPEAPPSTVEGAGPGERRFKIGKADLFGACVTDDADHCGSKGTGNCWCDKACIEFGDCCGDYHVECGDGAQGTCEELGGTCLSSPIDVTFGASCEQDFGLQTLDGACAAFNQTCCGETQCEPVLCELFCPYGFAAGDDGCPECSCAKPEACGGFGGFPCPEGKLCVDDPLDDCSPDNGGADCGGICVDPSPCELAGGSCHFGLLSSCGEGKTPSALDCGNLPIETTCCAPAPAPSCEGKCGGAAEGKACYCDELCDYYGDCCDDYEPQCGEERVPASGMCVRNGNEACTTDADCVSGGCGGELCYNASFGVGISPCDCSTPQNVGGCGCVSGKCSWYQ